jgi:hypothetical protein
MPGSEHETYRRTPEQQYQNHAHHCPTSISNTLAWRRTRVSMMIVQNLNLMSSSVQGMDVIRFMNNGIGTASLRKKITRTYPQGG